MLTRDQFGQAALAVLLRDANLKTIDKIRDLHSQLSDKFGDGCIAHGEGDECCIDAIVDVDVIAQSLSVSEELP